MEEVEAKEQASWAASSSPTLGEQGGLSWESICSILPVKSRQTAAWVEKESWMAVSKLILTQLWRGNPYLLLDRSGWMPGLKELKSNFVNMCRHRSSIKRDIVMKSFVPVEPEDIASYRSKNLEFMLIRQRNTKRPNWRNKRSDPIGHRRELEHSGIKWPEG